jgi:hypothetical protein
MKTSRSFFVAAALILSLASLPNFAQIQGPPNRIDYQGQVLDSSGNPLAPDTPTNYTMQFRLYDAQTGGTLLWSESQTVTVSKGAFSVRLGEGVAIPADGLPAGVQAAGLVNAFTGSDRFLGLTVVVPNQTPAEVTPRLAFLSSPFSFNANKSKEADSLTILDAGGNNRVGTARWDALFTLPTTTAAERANPANWKLKEQNVPAGISVPVGGVIMWWGASGAVPAGFEICNGGAPVTAGALIASKPDLRDKFVKGAGAAATNVAAANVSGGTHTVAQRDTAGTAISQAQLPNYVLPHTLGTAAAGNHSHTISDARNDAEDDDSGDGGKLASGQGQGLRPFPTLITDDAGNHTHAITGSITSGGGGQAHVHAIPAHDNRPAFLELFYIIRVK